MTNRMSVLHLSRGSAIHCDRSLPGAQFRPQSGRFGHWEPDPVTKADRVQWYRTTMDSIAASMIGWQADVWRSHNAQLGCLLYDIIYAYDCRNTLEINSLANATCLYAVSAHYERTHGHHIALDHPQHDMYAVATGSTVAAFEASTFLSVRLSSSPPHLRLHGVLDAQGPRSQDLVIVSRRMPDRHVASTISLAARLLRPQGWLIIDDVNSGTRSAEECAHLSALMSAAGIAATSQFRLGCMLLGRAFRDSALSALGGSHSHAAVTFDIIDCAFRRSVYDPDFRWLLLASPDTALSILSPKSHICHLGFRFHDRSMPPFISRHKERSYVHLTLPDPVWACTVTERQLEEMILKSTVRPVDVGGNNGNK